MPGIIEAQDLRKKFGDISAVDGITFAVNKGEVFGFLGPNGAGKTSTMKIIACVSPRTSGAVRVFDMDPDTSPAEIKQRLGVVPQGTNQQISTLTFPATVTCSLTHGILIFLLTLPKKKLRNSLNLCSYRKKGMLRWRNSPGE